MGIYNPTIALMSLSLWEIMGVDRPDRTYLGIIIFASIFGSRH